MRALIRGGQDRARPRRRLLFAFCSLGLLCAPPVVAQLRPAVADTVAQRALACTGCHGDQGRSSATGYVPRLAGKPAGYLFDQMQAFRDGRRAHHGMAQLLRNVDDALLRELAGHFASRDVPYPPPVPLPPGLDRSVPGRSERLARLGLPAARLPACAACHGSALMGDGDRVPPLLGLPRDYLVAQVGAWRQGSRSSAAGDCMAEVARRLPLADLPALADWLAAQPVPTGDAAGRPAPPVQRRAAVADLACRDAEPGSAVASAPAPAPAPAPAATAAVPAPSTAASAQVARGAYLATLGHCAGCHARPGSRELSGGEGLVTGFGTVHAGNLTPDPQTGLGRWTADDFWQALHLGRGRDGRRLVPAFPYASYTHVTRADSDALFAYLRSLPPVVRQRPDHALRFPYGTPLALAAWQALYFRPAEAAETGAPAGDAWARGRYLVQGLGHCLECHAPRGRWGARGDEPTGGVMPDGAWWAPPLHRLPGQTADDLVALLRDGRNRHASAMGPMATVVSRSTQHWQESDLKAAATYLMSLPAAPAPAAAHVARDPARLERGRRLYGDHCSSCHGHQGQGAGPPGGAGQGLPWVAPLAGNPGVTAPRLHNLVRALRDGGFGATTAAHPRPFGMGPQPLGAADLAALLTYIRQSWGNAAGEVTEVDLLTLR